MHIASLVRLRWFLDAYVPVSPEPVRMLFKGSADDSSTLQHILAERIKLGKQDMTMERYTKNLPLVPYDIVISRYFADELPDIGAQLAELGTYCQPHGLFCGIFSWPRVTGAGGAKGAEIANVSMLEHALACIPSCRVLHCSCNLAPPGALDDWYDDDRHTLLLVMQCLEGQESEEQPYRSNGNMWQQASADFLPAEQQFYTSARPLQEKKFPRTLAERINYLADIYKAETYLEIAGEAGLVAAGVTLPYKVSVGKVAVPIAAAGASGEFVHFPLDAETFFAHLQDPSSSVSVQVQERHQAHLFDIILLNGLHTFEQSLRDFQQSIRVAHDDSIIVFNASVPSDPYSSLPDRQLACQYRSAAGLAGNAWHGEVYKTIFAIHDLYPDYSYCTIVGPVSRSQTYVWKSTPSDRVPRFGSLEKIAQLNYFSMLEHAEVLLPVSSDLLTKLLGKTLDPSSYARHKMWKKLIYHKATVQP